MSTGGCFCQTNDRRIEDAIAESTFLKRVVAEQDRRIAELEKAVGALQVGTATELPRTSQVGQKPATSARANSATPWKTPSAWGRVKDGMSRSQVVAILGQPTSVEANVGSFVTLFYKGEVAGSGSVTGTVKLEDDRVWQVNTPVF